MPPNIPLTPGNWDTLNNTNQYTHRTGRFTPETSEAYETANITTPQNNLVLTALQQDADGMHYTSGAIDTLGKQAWTYGTFTFVAHVPSDAKTTATLWPAIWMLPADGSNGFEIDIMECINDAPGQMYVTLHDYANNWSQTTAYTPPATADGYHTFVLAWEPQTLLFLIDGHVVAMFTSHIPQTAAYLIVDLAVGVNAQWQPQTPPPTTVFPSVFVIRSFTYTPYSTPIIAPPVPPIAVISDAQYLAACKVCRQWERQS